MRTFEEIRTLLAEKISIEKKRLKSYKTKANSFDLANVIARHVEALMADSRNRELRRLLKKYPKLGTKSEYADYIQDRLRGTGAMANALKNFANTNDEKRPWNANRRKHKGNSR